MFDRLIDKYELKNSRIDLEHQYAKLKNLAEYYAEKDITGPKNRWKLAALHDDIENLHILLEAISDAAEAKPINKNAFKASLEQMKEQLATTKLEGRTEFRAGFPNSTPADVINKVDQSLDQMETIYKNTKREFLAKIELYLTNTNTQGQASQIRVSGN